MTKRATDLDKMGDYYIGQQNRGLIFSRSQWWKWTGAVWETRHDLVQAREIWDLMKHYRDIDGQSLYLGKHTALLRYLQSRLFVADDQLDALPHLINLQNGTYDLEAQKLRAHDPGNYLTTLLSFGYDLGATCPTWFDYLLSTFVEPKTMMHDIELTSFVQEAMGYSLTTDVSYHVSFWCVGEGANGKGTLFHVLEQLGGTGVTSLNVELLRKEQYQLANLAGKRMALCSESEAANNLVKDALIKALVAGDTMNVRQIRREPFELRPTIKLWWSMNEFPAIADTTEGFWRRVRIIPFNRKFEPVERILDLKEQLDADLPGIFNWAMLGLQRLRKNGSFTEALQVEKATREHRKDANPVELFIDDECLVGVQYRVAAAAIYDAYKGWSVQNGFRPHSRSNFKKEVRRLRMLDANGHDANIYDVRLAKAIFFKGICLSINPTFSKPSSVGSVGWTQTNLHQKTTTGSNN